MFLRRFLSMPAVLTLALAFLLGIMLVGGCPQQQVPSPPADDDDSQIDNPPDVDEPDQDRPIPPPADDGDDDGVDDGDDDGQQPPDDGDDDGGDGGDGGDDGGDDGGGTAPISLRINLPLDPIGMRPDPSADPAPTFPFGFRLSDPAGVVSSAQIVLARDEDGDGMADEGGPIPGSEQDVTYTSGENIETAYNVNRAIPFLDNNRGKFVVGMRVRTTTGAEEVEYAPPTITLDSVIPSASWVSPTQDHLINPAMWPISLITSDNAPHTLRVLLDTDTDPANGFAAVLVPETEVDEPLNGLREYTVPVTVSAGTYHYYVEVSDGVEPALEPFYARDAQGVVLDLGVTERLIGEFALDSLDPEQPEYDNDPELPSKGAIFQGFNFNDLAGSSMAAVPDVNGDGYEEVLFASRFGKPVLTNEEGIGFGEAYLLYGSPERLRDVLSVNNISGENLPGLAFPGIRAPMNTSWTEGLADVTVVPDMDGDELPELVFSFPRVESVSLWTESTEVQHPQLIPDIAGMGVLEYDAYYPDMMGWRWHTNEAQFTRGGIVIVSSHAKMLRDPERLNRKGDRILDLAEVGQMFIGVDGEELVWGMGIPEYKLYVKDATEEPGVQTADCSEDPQNPEEVDYQDWTIYWDVVFENQGPGGFDTYYTSLAFGELVEETWQPDPYRPPLAGYRYLPFTIDPSLNGILAPNDDPCLDENCVYAHEWYVWGKCEDNEWFPGALSNLCDNPSWHASYDGSESQVGVWSGFYGGGPTTACTPLLGNNVGARILGQRREDRFGSAVAADGTYLYMSAPQRNALQYGTTGDNVPSLEADRPGAGVVYQMRTFARPSNSPVPLTQLWIEPADDFDEEGEPVFQVDWPAWPVRDAELYNMEGIPPSWYTDYTMPVPHQYIIEDVGYIRGYDRYWAGVPGEGEAGDPIVTYTYESENDCPPLTYTSTGGVPANTMTDGPFGDIGPGAAHYYVDRTTQIVGPHIDAHLSFVRGLGDINDDGVRDFAVGSADVMSDFSDPQAPNGDTVGAVFIVFNRQPGFETDHLLDRMALPPGDIDRVRGVLLRGSNADDRLGRVFDDAGDVDGDDVADVVVGGEGANNGAGQAVVILGSSTLESPEGGWTVEDIVAQGRGIRFAGVSPGDLTGANVAGAGDVDGDGFSDILIAAPGAEGGKGAVYLVYGSSALVGQDVSLAAIGTVDLPGVKFIGRADGDQLGGGTIRFPDDRPVDLNPDGTPVTVHARGVSSLGDIDGDGLDDFAIGAMLADPNGRNDSGELYLIYGRGD